MDMTIRLAGADDIPQLNELIPASARELSRGFYAPGEVEAAVAHVFGVDTRLIDDGTFFVADAGGRVVGCGGWSRRATLFGGDAAVTGRDDRPLDPATDPARVRAFFVHPDCARRGIGRRLLAACEAAAREAGFGRAELVATLPGEPLYAACGYQIVERLTVDTPAGPLPVVRMAKDLDGC